MTNGRKKLLGIFLLGLLLIPYRLSLGITGESSAETIPTDAEIILDGEQGQAFVTYELAADSIAWQVSYVKASSQENRRIKFQVETLDASQLGAPENVEPAVEIDEAGWWHPEQDFSNQESNGNFTFTTALLEEDASYSLVVTCQLEILTPDEEIQPLLEEPARKEIIVFSKKGENVPDTEDQTDTGTKVAEKQEEFQGPLLTPRVQTQSITENVSSTEHPVVSPFVSEQDMANFGDERDIFLYNVIVTGNHSAVQADNEGAMVLFGDSIIPAGAMGFSYGGYFTEGTQTYAGMPLTARHKINLLIGGAIKDFSEGIVNVMGSRAKDEKNPGYVLVDGLLLEDENSWVSRSLDPSALSNKVTKINGPVKTLTTEALATLFADIKTQQETVYSMVENKISALELDQNLGNVTTWEGINLPGYRSLTDPHVAVLKVPENINGAAYLPTFALESTLIKDSGIHQIIVTSEAEKILLMDLTGGLSSTIAAKVVYYLPNATQLTNFSELYTGAIADIANTSKPPELPAFNTDAVNHYSSEYFATKTHKGPGISGFIMAPKATAVFSGANVNGYLWVENYFQSGGMETHNFYNPWVEEQVKFLFRLYKHDSENQDTPIENAEFKFYREKAEIKEYLKGFDTEGMPLWDSSDGKLFITDQQGEVTISGIPEDHDYHYFFEEIAPAEGYVLPSDPIFQVEMNTLTSKPNRSIVSNTKEEEQLFSFSFTKKIAGSEGTLTGASFALLQGEEVVKRAISDDVGEVTFANLKAGDYILRETSAPEKFALMSDKSISIDAEGNVEGLIGDSIENHYKKIYLEFLKTDEQSNPLTGAKFVLKNVSGGDLSEFQGEEVRDDNNELTKVRYYLDDVLPGTYTLMETEAPGGYQVLGDIGTVTVTEQREVTFVQRESDNQNKATVAFTGEKIVVSLPTVVNQKIPSLKLKVQKLDGEGKVGLDGAEFTLTGPNGMPKKEVTADGGWVAFEDLSPGAYQLTETSPPPGFQLSNEASWLFTITQEGNLQSEGDFSLEDGVITKSITNQVRPFDLTVFKTDEKGTPLPGAQFTLRGENDYEEIKGPSESVAEFVFRDLVPGTYTLEESLVPAGYVAYTKTYKITIADDGIVSVTPELGEAVAVQLLVEENNQIEITLVNYRGGGLPRTGGNGWLSYFALGGMVMCLPLWTTWRKGRREVQKHEK